jgi:putative superfamily III holin-X
LANGSGTPEEPRPQDAGGSSSPASIIELAFTVLQALGMLLAGKLRLAEKEFSQDLGTVARAAGLVVGVLVLVMLALGLAGAGLALLLAPWVGSTGAALLLVAAIYLLGGLVFLALARNSIRRMGGFLSASRADLKRDAEWLKNLS